MCTSEALKDALTSEERKALALKRASKQAALEES
jgi:hypothetical protein